MFKYILIEDWDGNCISCGSEDLYCEDIAHVCDMFIKQMECGNCQQRADIYYKIKNAAIEFF